MVKKQEEKLEEDDRYYYFYDSLVERRVPCVLIDGIFYSLVSGEIIKREI